MSFLLKHPTASSLAIFAVLIAVFYGNTLANGFVQDDVWLIETNERVHSLMYLPQVISGEVISNEGTQAAVYYRPMQSLAYILTYAISGSAAFFHFMNLVYFWGILAALFLFVRELTGKALGAFFAGMVLGMHPIVTEVVNWPSAVPELLMALFALLPAYFYVKHRHHEHGRPARLASESVAGRRATKHLYISL